MSRQPLLLYSLIVERSVSHPVRLTAGVPLVTPRCPLPTDAIVAAMTTEESQALQDVRQYWEGRGGNPGAVCRSPLSRVSLRAFPCDFFPHPPLRKDFVILSPLYVKGIWVKMASCSFYIFFFLILHSVIQFFFWLASFRHRIMKMSGGIETLDP